MDKLEKFITDLNKIQRELKSEENLSIANENDYLEKVAMFLFNAESGWNILMDIYSQKIQVLTKSL